MGFDLEQDASQLSSDKVLSNDENKALQKKYLGYYSYKEVKRPLTQSTHSTSLNLIIYIICFTVVRYGR